YVRAGRVHRDAVHAVPDLGRRIGDLLGPEPAVDRAPRPAGVVAPEHARRGDGDEDALGTSRVEDDRVQAHPARPRLPRRGRVVAAQAGKLLPRLAAVDRAEERRVLNPGVDRIRIGRGRLEMPHARELPRSWRAVVPEVRAHGTLVGELVSHRLPRLAAV